MATVLENGDFRFDFSETLVPIGNILPDNSTIMYLNEHKDEVF